MSDIAIRVENLGKMYRIGVGRRRHDTLRDAVVDGVRHLLRRDGRRREEEIIWALKDVSFEVKRGEVVGIIGRNGAGKSTLLKILSRITEPTTGYAEIHGRVGSLLEVGTGFHPELTGRENIYLNGAILGMKKAEIDRKFDEIVAFAEIERFLDTPVKHYSSGMYVRLAFAVAAHLEPEILLVDEVLAVGDAAFQKKCLGKMGDVAGEGRTVLFVSHNMEAVSGLTQRALLLHTGTVEMAGLTRDVVSYYLEWLARHRDSRDDSVAEYHREAIDDTSVFISSVWVEDTNGHRRAVYETRETFKVCVSLHAREYIDSINMSLALKNSLGQRVLQLFSLDKEFEVRARPGQLTLIVTVRDLPLAPGDYYCDIGINRSSWTKAYDVVLDLPLLKIKFDQEPEHWANRPYGSIMWDNIIWECAIDHYPRRLGNGHE